jgi:chromosome segregation ATPase
MTEENGRMMKIMKVVEEQNEFLIEAAQKNKEIMEKRREDFKGTIETLKGEKETLKSLLKRCEDSKDHKKKMRVDQRVREMERLNQKLTADYETAVGEIAELKAAESADARDKREERTKLLTEVEEIKKQLAECEWMAKSKSAECRDQNERMISKLRNKESEYAQLQEEKKATTTKIEELTKKVAEMTKEKTNCEDGMEAYRVSYEQSGAIPYKKKTGDFTAKFEGIDTQPEKNRLANEEETKELKTRLAATENELNKTKTLLSSYSDRLDTSLAHIEAQEVAQEESKVKYISGVEKAKNLIKELETKLAEKETEIEEAKEMAATNTRLQGEKETAVKKNEEYEEETTELKTRLAATENELNKTKTLLSSYSDRLDTSLAHIEAQEVAQEESKVKYISGVEKAKNLIKVLETKLAEKENEIEEAKEMAATNTRLRGEKETAVKKNEEYEEETKELKTQKYEEAKEEIDRLNDENTELKETVGECERLREERETAAAALVARRAVYGNNDADRIEAEYEKIIRLAPPPPVINDDDDGDRSEISKLIDNLVNERYGVAREDDEDVDDKLKFLAIYYLDVNHNNLATTEGKTYTVLTGTRKGRYVDIKEYMRLLSDDENKDERTRYVLNSISSGYGGAVGTGRWLPVLNLNLKE